MASEGSFQNVTDSGITLKCVLEATVVTGFEGIAKEECIEKLGVHAKCERGRIFIEIDISRAHEALKLRGVDNILVVVKDFSNFNIPSDKEEAFKEFCKLASEIDWVPSLSIWAELTKFRMPLDQIIRHMGTSHTNEIQSSKNEIKQISKELEDTQISSDNNTQTSDVQDNSVPVKEVNDDVQMFKEFLSKKDCETCDDAVPKFRVSCNRSGKQHPFSSQELACHFGGAVQDYFQWQADMKNHDIHVVLTVNDRRVYLCLTVTKESLHNRNLEHFGPTSLRSTIAHNMLRMCSIRTGDVVCDPMCGGGTLPIEGSLCWPKSHFICGDNHDLAWARTLQNLQALSAKQTGEGCKPVIDVQKWDARNLPLRDNSVDIIVTDLPFGKRLGTRTDNRNLYPKVLREMARVCRLGKGRAVLLTQDRQSLTKAVLSQSSLWWQKRVLAVNIGGLAASVYLLQRTNKPQYRAAHPPTDSTQSSTKTAEANNTTDTETN